LDHARHEVAGQRERGGQVELEQGGPLGVVSARERGGARGPGVVDEDLDRGAEAVAQTCHFGQEAGAVGRVAELAREHVDLAAGERTQLGGDSGEGVPVAAGQHERVAGGEGAGDGAADAAAGPGDEREG
jgi:hypothetical protein